MLVAAALLWTLAAHALDVETLDAELTPRADGSLQGVMTVRGVVVSAAATQVQFKGERLTVTSARVDGKAAAFSGSGPITVTLPAPARSGDLISVELSYTARPVSGLMGSALEGHALRWWTPDAPPVWDWVPALDEPWDRATITWHWVLPRGSEAACAGPRVADEPLPGDKHRVTCQISNATLAQSLPLVVGRLKPNVVAPGITLLAPSTVSLPRVSDATASIQRLTTLQQPPGILTLVVGDDDVEGVLHAADVPAPGWEPEPRAWVEALVNAWLPPSSLSVEERQILVRYLGLMVLEDLLGTAQARLDAWPVMAEQPALRALHAQRARQGDDVVGGLVASVFRNHGVAVFPKGAAWVERPVVRVEALPQGTTLSTSDATVSNWTARVTGLGDLRGSLMGVGTLPAGTVTYVVVDDGWWTGAHAPRMDAAWLRGAVKDAPEPATRARALESLDDDGAAWLNALEKDPAGLVREVAATALGRVERPETVRALEAALEDGEPRVQAAAATSLCTMGDIATLRKLGKLAGAPGYARVREAAGRSLGCHVKDGGDLVARALRLNTPGHRVEAAVTSGICQVDPSNAQLLSVMEKGGAAEFLVAAACVDAAKMRAGVLRAAWARVTDPRVDVRLGVLALLDRLHADEARRQLKDQLPRENHGAVRARMQELLNRW